MPFGRTMSVAVLPLVGYTLSTAPALTYYQRVSFMLIVVY
jgi:hypothetical protein